MRLRPPVSSSSVALCLENFATAAPRWCRNHYPRSWREGHSVDHVRMEQYTFWTGNERLIALMIGWQWIENVCIVDPIHLTLELSSSSAAVGAGLICCIGIRTRVLGRAGPLDSAVAVSSSGLGILAEARLMALSTLCQFESTAATATEVLVWNVPLPWTYRQVKSTFCAIR